MRLDLYVLKHQAVIASRGVGSEEGDKTIHTSPAAAKREINNQAYTRSTIQKAIVKGYVSVNGVVQYKPSKEISHKDAVVLLMSLREVEKLLYKSIYVPNSTTHDLDQDLNYRLDTLYEDDDLLIINKPVNLTCHLGNGMQGTTITIVDILLSKYPACGPSGRPFLVHRLDRYTSGCMLIAKTDSAYNNLVSLMAARKIRRRYVALVHNPYNQLLQELVPIKDYTTNTITTGIKPSGKADQQYRFLSCSEQEEGAKLAITHYKLLEYFPKAQAALLEIELDTGRTHQIRVHMQHIKCHIVGDDIYGNTNRKWPVNAILNSILKTSKQFLHAIKLRLPHPCRPEEIIDVQAPIRADMQQALDILQTL